MGEVKIQTRTLRQPGECRAKQEFPREGCCFYRKLQSKGPREDKTRFSSWEAPGNREQLE